MEGRTEGEMEGKSEGGMQEKNEDTNLINISVFFVLVGRGRKEEGK